jgi:hypothetical protein
MRVVIVSRRSTFKLKDKCNANKLDNSLIVFLEHFEIKWEIKYVLIICYGLKQEKNTFIVWTS